MICEEFAVLSMLLLLALVKVVKKCTSLAATTESVFDTCLPLMCDDRRTQGSGMRTVGREQWEG